MEWYWVVVAIIVFLIYAYIKDKVKRYDLSDKYQDKEIIEKIMRKVIWEGATEEHVLDSLGNPKERDVKILHGRNTATWTYDNPGEYEYIRNVYFDEKIVIGWETKHEKV